VQHLVNLREKKRDTQWVYGGWLILVSARTNKRNHHHGEPGECLSTLHPYSDAGCADLPITLWGAPVNIGQTRVTVSRRRQDREPGNRPPGTGPHVSVRHGALGELA
jgi:hypothetical protein